MYKTIEKIGCVDPIINIDGEPYFVNVKEYQNFVDQCRDFMEVDGNSLQVMTQIISDQLVDGLTDDANINDIRAELKFLREVGFFLRGTVTPLVDSDLR